MAETKIVTRNNEHGLSATAPWISVIGLGLGGLMGLSPGALAALQGAERVYGSRRQHELLMENEQNVDKSLQKRLVDRRITWPSPLMAGLKDLDRNYGRPMAVLASGDPMWFGIGGTLARRYGREQMRIFPAPGAFSLACAKLAWPMESCVCLSLHGRPMERLSRALFPGARIICLTDNAQAPAKIARFLVEKGQGAARMHVLSRLGGADEYHDHSQAAAFDHQPDNLNVVALEIDRDIVCASEASAAGGLDDAQFSHDGQMTKKQVRRLTLAKLRPYPGARLLDVGAGAGSVSIEWMQLAEGASATGLEPVAARRERARANAARLGLTNFELREGSAPAAYSDLPEMDAVFVGGGISQDGVLEGALKLLRRNGRFVANAVTLEGETALATFFTRFGGRLERINLSYAAPVGSLTGWRPSMGVTQYSLTKT